MTWGVLFLLLGFGARVMVFGEFNGKYNCMLRIMFPTRGNRTRVDGV